MADYKLKIEGRSGDRLGYLQFPAHPGMGTTGVVAKSIRLIELIAPYEGPDLALDFDKDNQIIGIEIID